MNKNREMFITQYHVHDDLIDPSDISSCDKNCIRDYLIDQNKQLMEQMKQNRKYIKALTIKPVKYNE